MGRALSGLSCFGYQIDVLEVLKGIRVITSSEMRNPDGDEPVKQWKNHNWDSGAGKARRAYKHKDKLDKSSKRAARDLFCKKCGGEGHFAKTCKNPPRVEVAPSELPDKEIAEIVKEERSLEPVA